jgi:hypothetical protein
MTTRDHLFLIVFDRVSDDLTVEDLGQDLDEAMRTYSVMERESADDGNLEVVLIGSPSLDALRRTHSSYFGTSEALRPVLPRRLSE